MKQAVEAVVQWHRPSASANEVAASFHKVCELDDLWVGEMFVYDVQGTKVLLVHTEEGKVSAIQPKCPHQSVPLVDGRLEGNILTCTMHLWELDVTTGKGVNPCHAAIARYPVKIIDGEVWVSTAGVEPQYCRP